MDAKQLLDMITVEQILILMNDFNIPYRENGSADAIQFQTVCHGGDSHKLYFYLESKTFYCYTNCGSMNIIELVQKLRDCSFGEAVGFLTRRFGFTNNIFKEGFEDEIIEEFDFELDMLKKYKEYLDNPKSEQVKELEKLDDKLLNHFNDIYHKSFINDGISIRTMKKYEIKLDIYEYRIIIPHRNEDGDLIAIRCRNLDEDLVNRGMKYTPIYMDGKFLSAPTSRYLYGLDKNKESIKAMRKVILLESEKSVMQLDTMLNDKNFSVALSSSSLSKHQVNMLIDLGVEEVIVALDKEYEEYGTEQEKMYARKIRKSIIDKLSSFFKVSVIWDTKNLIGFKESPTDRGFEVFNELYKNRIVI